MYIYIYIYILYIYICIYVYIYYMYIYNIHSWHYDKPSPPTLVASSFTIFCLVLMSDLSDPVHCLLNSSG